MTWLFVCYIVISSVKKSIGGRFIMRKSLRKISAAIAGCALAMALTIGAVPNAASAARKPQSTKAGIKAGKAKFDPDGTYHAYFGFQQKDTWIFRDAWFNPNTGRDGKDLKNLDYNGLLQSGDNGTTQLESTKVTDAEITGNGTYTIGVTGINSALADPDGESNVIALIYASTDIPLSAIEDGTVKVTDVKMSIDGKEAFSGEPYINEDTKLLKLYQFDCVNTWQNEGYENPSILTPKDSIQITFTISGFNKDNPNAVEATAAADTSSSAGSSSTSSASSSAEESSGSSSGTVAVVVVVAVVVIAGVVVYIKKKKN